MNSRRRTLLLTGAGLAAAAAGVGLALYRATSGETSRAAVDRLFAQTFDDADGRAQPMVQWKGRWLVVNFWATWCAPCVEEMPTLQQAARDYANRGVAVVGLGIDNAEAIRRFQRELALDLPLLVAGTHGSTLARELGNPSGALPYTVLISPQGTVAQTQLGRIRPETLQSWLGARATG